MVELTNLLRAMHCGMAYVCVWWGGRGEGGRLIVTEVNIKYGKYKSTLLLMPLVPTPLVGGSVTSTW